MPKSPLYYHVDLTRYPTGNWHVVVSDYEDRTLGDTEGTYSECLNAVDLIIKRSPPSVIKDWGEGPHGID